MSLRTPVVGTWMVLWHRGRDRTVADRGDRRSDVDGGVVVEARHERGAASFGEMVHSGEE
jgi:hypothetical protein